MGKERAGVLNWFRDFFALSSSSEEHEAVAELHRQKERSHVIKSGMDDAAKKLKETREAVHAQLRELRDSHPGEKTDAGQQKATG